MNGKTRRLRQVDTGIHYACYIHGRVEDQAVGVQGTDYILGMGNC